MVVPQFAHFNLGGEVFHSAREQMAHAASLTGVSSPTCHGSLFGGRFQWGRADMAHAIGGNFTLWDGATGNAIIREDAAAIGFNSVTAQPLGAATSRFITTTTGGWIPETHIALNSFMWGNGVSRGNRTDDRGLADLGVPGLPGTDGEGQYFQSTSWVLPGNNPCRHMPLPGNWRVPTQEEWERIVNYDFDPAMALTPTVAFPANSFSVVPNANSPFTWVRVSCIDGDCTPTISAGWTAATRNGFALYLTSSLPAGFTFTASTSLLADDSPEPFLFLPAGGMRFYTGNVVDMGVRGRYWSTSVTVLNSVISPQISATGVGISAVSAHNNGVSVRCIRD